MRTKLLLITGLLLILGLFSTPALACDGRSSNTEATGKNEILGTVYHTDSRKPLRDVVVTAYGSNKKEFRAYTDNQGNYMFSDLKPGMYRLVFELDGFRKVSRDKVFLKTDDGYHLDIGLEEVNDFEWVPGIFNFSGGD